jgi:hypothetical protein
MRERVCRLQLVLALASAVILGSEYRWTRNHILLSQIRVFFSLPPTTRRAMVEVFDPASTRDRLSPSQSQGQSHIETDGQSVSLGVEPHLGFMTRYLLPFDSHGLVFVEITL